MPCSNSTYTGGKISGSYFKNYVGKVNMEVGTMWRPETLRDLVHVLVRAENEDRRVHAVGAGWSFEDLAASPDWMIDMCNMKRILPALSQVKPTVNPALANWWRAELARPGGRRFVHVEAGARIFDILTQLDAQRLTLPTMGGSHGQTIAGAMSTSTHGSDYMHRPLCDLVLAVHLVASGGREFWIEAATNPLTSDNTALRNALSLCPELQILRDDTLLRSVQVGLGRFGVIYSVVLSVTGAHDLVETATRLDWPSVALSLLKGVGKSTKDAACFGSLPELLPLLPASLGATTLGRRDFKYLDIVFATRQPNSCWVRRRYVAPAGGVRVGGGSSSTFLCDHGAANGLLLAAVAALQAYKAALLPHAAYDPSIPFFKIPLIDVKSLELTARATDPHLTGGAALALALNAFWEVEDPRAPVDPAIAELTTFAVASEMTAAETTGKRGRNWHIAAGASDPSGIGACFRANSIEVIFSLGSRAYIDFIGKVLGSMLNHHQSGYMSIRFSRRSDAHLSMHNVDHDVACSVEVTSLLGLSGNPEWFRWLEATAVRLGGRPHWGQQNELTAPQVETLYGRDRLLVWRRQLGRIVGLSGVFSNAFTQGRGLEPAPMKA